MGSLTIGPSGLDGSTSLEMALDQGIARRFASVQERSSKSRRSTALPTSMASSVPSRETALAVIPARLSWRGIAVSEDFQEYAIRVASGEQLAPYRGQVLSRETPEFPGTSLAPTSNTVPTPTLPRYPERGRPLRTTLWSIAAVGSIVGALSVGAGATSAIGTATNLETFEPRQATAALAPSSPLGARPSELDSQAPRHGALEAPSLEAELGAPSTTTEHAAAAVSTPAVAGLAHAARSADALRSPPAPALATSNARNPKSAVSGARPSSRSTSSSDASRPLAPPASPVTGASTRGLSGPDSALFSEQPSF
jgi:hypothetical protein